MPLRSNLVTTAATVLLAAGGLIAVAPVPAAVANSLWTVVRTPNPAKANGLLRSVSCADTSTCIAVGDRLHLRVENDRDHLLAERWDGTKWSQTPEVTPTDEDLPAQFNSVACSSASTCIAVGSYVNSSGHTLPLAEQWDGAGWMILPAALPSSAYAEFDGVSCSSATACTAVGANLRDGQALAERWNGTVWTEQPLPAVAPGTEPELDAVSCPSATTCFAVGFDHITQQAVAASWRNAKWHSVVVPEPTGATSSELLAVGCGSANLCRAVGYARGGSEPGLVAEAWNGTALTIDPVPTPAGWTKGRFSGVSCNSGSVCRAVGEAVDADGLREPIAFGLRNGEWFNEPFQAPQPPLQAELTAISCPVSTTCTAVGDFETGLGAAMTLAERSSGNSWYPRYTPTISGVDRSLLGDIDCTTPSDCASVGAYFGPFLAPLTESWDGAHWALTPTPVPPFHGLTPSYNAVSCPSGGPCVAVGNGAPAFAAFRTTNPVQWSVQSLPMPATANFGLLNSVSCPSSTFCVAVGNYLSSSGDEGLLIDTFDGTTWSVASPEQPPVVPDLSAVSCSSATACLAVGNDGHGRIPPIAESWDGTSWKLTSAPPFGTLTTLFDVSCRTATYCVAVGVTNPQTGSTTTAALATWINGAWTSRSLSLPEGVTSPGLNGINCPTGTSTCTAVGADRESSAIGGTPLAVQGTSTAWTGTVLPVPSGEAGAVLQDVRCFSTGECEAVGYSTDEHNVHKTLVERLH